MTTDPQARPAAAAGPERVFGSLVFTNLSRLASEPNGVAWQPFYPGVDIHWLYRDGEDGPSSALIRFQPGASVPLHEHRGFEHIYILSGSQSDGANDLEAGSLMVHPPGTRHRIVSKNGCLALAIYERPAKFVGENSAAPS